MAESDRRRNVVIAVVVVVILAVLLLLTRCLPERVAAPAEEGAAPPEAPIAAPSPGGEPVARPEPVEAAEVLTPATLTVPERVPAGAAFTVTWAGPDNRGDFVAVVRADAPDDAPGNYAETQEGATLELTAPIEAGAHEVRYITGRSRTVLGRAPIEIEPVGAALEAPAEVVLGSAFAVAWTGPDNKGDYVTVVAAGAPDDHYGNFVDTAKGSPVTLTAPVETGEAEVRYVSGQGRKVLARRRVRIVGAEVSLSAPAEAIAGTTVEVVWTGPDNVGDYITVVPAGTPDGRYDNYTDTSRGSPLPLLMPIMDGGAELRYMTGQGDRVLSRRPIRIVAAAVTLSAPAESAAGAPVTITWTGPNNPGDYITVVPKGTPDSGYRDYKNTTSGSPLTVKAPAEPGDAEVRYVTGQDSKVLARIPIRIVR